MPVVKTRSVFRGIAVEEAMRRQVVHLPVTADIAQGIRMLIRCRVNAVLLTDQGIPCGVVSKTDLMGAMYAEFPTTTPLGDVMGSQPIACFPDDPLEASLEIMEAAGVHRLYVTGADRETVIGTISYAEIVGLLYRYCRACERGTTKKRIAGAGMDPAARFVVREVMTPDVWTSMDEDSLTTVMEALATRHMGAVLILDRDHRPVGVISKTDLIVAYHHDVATATCAHEVMNRPVHRVSADDLLSVAIRQMLIKDVQRLFVSQDAAHPEHIVGVLALSDAARFRSGSCRACTAGRLLTR